MPDIKDGEDAEEHEITVFPLQPCALFFHVHILRLQDCLASITPLKPRLASSTTRPAPSRPPYLFKDVLPPQDRLSSQPPTITTTQKCIDEDSSSYFEDRHSSEWSYLGFLEALKFIWMSRDRATSISENSALRMRYCNSLKNIIAEEPTKTPEGIERVRVANLLLQKGPSKQNTSTGKTSVEPFSDSDSTAELGNPFLESRNCFVGENHRLSEIDDLYKHAVAQGAHEDPIWWRIVDVTKDSKLPLSHGIVKEIKDDLQNLLNQFKISEPASTLFEVLFAKGVLDELSRSTVKPRHTSKDKMMARLEEQALTTSSASEPTEPLCQRLSSIDPGNEEILWLFDVLHQIYTNIKLGITNRHNSEGDIDVYYNSLLFRTLATIVDVHYGEVCSRASRERQQSAVDGTKTDEGSKVDWIFCNHKLDPGQAWGREFGLVESAGPKSGNKTKIASDMLKIKKNLRDMLRALDRALPFRGHSTILDSVRSKIFLPAITFSAWTFRIIGMCTFEEGYYGVVDVATFTIPLEAANIRNGLKCCKSILVTKRILQEATDTFKTSLVNRN
ncbi:hypothetical protein BC938DRAFT_482430 [Jimgerdemannia flammicorona]|uniref:Uncharacterized protein n=1 Tax=Jimgerdemannia flammicorona TaxID=994334 RepID=A0A433QE54_9FUNG|nr:hypothetical protein BC938DRAFT_482430 [Jimgerdemannia flammicorona]